MTSHEKRVNALMRLHGMTKAAAEKRTKVLESAPKKNPDHSRRATNKLTAWRVLASRYGVSLAQYPTYDRFADSMELFGFEIESGLKKALSEYRKLYDKNLKKNPTTPRITAENAVIASRYWSKTYPVMYVEELRGKTHDWGYTTKVDKALPLSPYWAKRFAADMRAVGVNAVFSPALRKNPVKNPVQSKLQTKFTFQFRGKRGQYRNDNEIVWDRKYYSLTAVPSAMLDIIESKKRAIKINGLSSNPVQKKLQSRPKPAGRLNKKVFTVEAKHGNTWVTEGIFPAENAAREYARALDVKYGNKMFIRVTV